MLTMLEQPTPVFEPAVIVGPKAGSGGRKGLGRGYAADPGDRNFLVSDRMDDIQRAVREVRGAVALRKIPWKRGPMLDQEQTSECTVYTAAAIKACAPIWLKNGVPWTRAQFTDYYRRAQRVDEWEGENYDGTSFRGVMKVLQSAGKIGTYVWADSEEAAQEYIRTVAPMGLGYDHFSGMDRPSDKGAYVEPTGWVRGGHETTVRWWYDKRHYKYPDTYEIIGSWGTSYGENGIVRMKADTFRYLAFQLNGDLGGFTDLRIH